MKIAILKLLCWIDDNINHRFIEKVFLSHDNKTCRWLWENLSYNYCQKVQIGLYNTLEEKDK